jgi:hypothetical protein
LAAKWVEHSDALMAAWMDVQRVAAMAVLSGLCSVG